MPILAQDGGGGLAAYAAAPGQGILVADPYGDLLRRGAYIPPAGPTYVTGAGVPASPVVPAPAASPTTAPSKYPYGAPSPAPQNAPGGGAPTGGGGGTTGGGTPGSPTGPNPYDFSTDPVLQQVQAAMAKADANAKASALRQQEQLLLNYGDPTLAGSVLGASDPYVQAAAQNQSSTLAQLARQYQQNLYGFESGLDPSLVFSGYRVKSEGQIGQANQDALSNAASNVQTQLQAISDALQQQLAADQAQIMQAYSDAYNRAIERALANQTA